ncbi:MAG: TolC family protein [Mariprofundaceae bacterium]|nr:TolC family protein [Mariprofundaceae bacterium]
MIIFPATLSAGEAMPLTVNAAVARAMQANRQVLARHRAVDAADARTQQARSARLPQVSWQTSVLRSNAPLTAFGSRLSQQAITAADFAPSRLNYPAAITQYQHRLVLDVPIYHGGALSAGVAQAEANRDVQQAVVLQTQQQIIFQVITAYSQALRAQHATTVAKQALKAATAHVNTAQQMLDKGMLLKSDVMDAEVHRLNAEVVVTQAEHRYQDAEDQLRQLLAWDNHQPLALAPWSGSATEQSRKNVAYWQQQAVSNRPELKTMHHQLSVLAATKQRTEASFRPTLGLQVAQEWHNNSLTPQHGNTTVMAALQWNIFAGGADRAAYQAAEADEAGQMLAWKDQAQKIAVQVRSALRQREETKSRLSVRQQAQKQAQESLRIHRVRFAQGMENINTMLDAQTRLDQAAASVVQARFDHQMAAVQLLLSAGMLKPTSFSHP